jgi:hypothetical protein
MKWPNRIYIHPWKRPRFLAPGKPSRYLILGRSESIKEHQCTSYKYIYNITSYRVVPLDNALWQYVALQYVAIYDSSGCWLTCRLLNLFTTIAAILSIWSLLSSSLWDSLILFINNIMNKS